MIPGRGAAVSALLLLLGYPLNAHPTTDVVIQPSNNVGCVFSQHVCLEDEQCFDDGLLGRCISAAAQDVEHLYRSGPINSQDLHMLAAEMKRVLSQGYTWEDEYSQCIFQSIVDHINQNSDYVADECDHLMTVEEPDSPQDDSYLAPAPSFDSQQYLVDSDLQYQPQFSDYDPTDLQFPEIIPLDPEMEPEDDMYQSDVVQPLPDIISSPYSSEQLPFEYLTNDPPSYVSLDSDSSPDLMSSDGDVYTVHYVPDEEEDQVEDDDDDDEVIKVVSPLSGRSDRTKRRSTDWVVLKDPELSNYDDNTQGQNYDFDYTDSEQFDEDGNSDAVYYSTEARFPLETVFDRRERLDVKKPGPFYTNSQNNFFIDKILRGEYSDSSLSSDDMDGGDGDGQTEHEFPLLTQDKQKKSDWGGSEIFSLGFEGTSSKQPSYLIVYVRDRLSTLSQATSILQAVADQLHLPLQTFGERKLGPNQMSVEVHDNPAQLNASTIAEKLSDQVDSVNAKIPSGFNIQVSGFSAGSQSDVTSVFTGHSRLFLALFLLTAGISSALVVAGLLLIVRRRASNKMEKEIVEDEVKPQPVTEYKQLVRDWSRSSRASQSSNPPSANSTAQEGEAGKGKVEERAGQKQPLASVPAKTQNSEGSRTSSTSSWHEELGVTTMDISTGHMVLNYMEDHLKNAQRLEQEWVGLCAYEAEPSATTVAFKVENRKKNRYPDKLPYDHNRVLLNALVNHDNSDYINASTVTDHDPRNPGYIVTQGPLAHTVADFWQMVWEQGSVVIVMLSRLSENGYQLVHRYWPEEGSQTYHIYEVHLVSEHVWCEDYLVRSLYLKNTRTGETRTVTQFHLLAWPDRSLPETTKSLLEFRRKVNKSYRGRSCPIIVHCSDGVGRSGSYVLLDMVLNKINKGSKEIDIAATLEHIRDQRTGMVQTKSQFEFCLTAVAEETHAVLKCLAQ